MRLHAPQVPAVRGVLFALHLRMDRDGECFPAQGLLATDTAFSERTVREALLEARRGAWLAVADHVRYGKGWRLSHYFACVPDALDLEAIDLGGGIDLEAIADQTQAQFGTAGDPLHGTARPAKRRGARRRRATGAATVAARSPGKAQGKARTRHEGAANGASDVRQPAQDRAATSANIVRQPSPIKVPSEVSKKVPSEEGHALTRMTALARESKRQTPDPGAQPEATPATTNGSDHGSVAPEVLQGLETRTRPTPKLRTAEAGLKLVEALLGMGEGPLSALAEAQRQGYPVTDEHLRQHLQRGAA